MHNSLSSGEITWDSVTTYTSSSSEEVMSLERVKLQKKSKLRSNRSFVKSGRAYPEAQSHLQSMEGARGFHQKQIETII